MVPKYHATVDYTPRLRAPQNLLRCMANSDTCEAVANKYDEYIKALHSTVQTQCTAQYSADTNRSELTRGS